MSVEGPERFNGGAVGATPAPLHSDFGVRAGTLKGSAPATPARILQLLRHASEAHGQLVVTSLRYRLQTGSEVQQAPTVPPDASHIWPAPVY